MIAQSNITEQKGRRHWRTAYVDNSMARLEYKLLLEVPNKRLPASDGGMDLC